MTQTQIVYELPFLGVNFPAIRATAINQFEAIDEVGVVRNTTHSDAHSNDHLIKLLIDINPSEVSQTEVDKLSSELQDILGCNVRQIGWGDYQ
jgi:predicted metal-dependent peptidase